MPARVSIAFRCRRAREYEHRGRQTAETRSGGTTMAERLHVAIRKFPPFERAIEEQFASFKHATGCPLELDALALDLNPLVDALFTNNGLKNGEWDVAFIVTDWLAEAAEDSHLADLSPLLTARPIADYPSGWA